MKILGIRFTVTHDKFRKFLVTREVAEAVESSLVQKQPSYFISFVDADFKKYIFQTATIESLEIQEKM